MILSKGLFKFDNILMAKSFKNFDLTENYSFILLI
jgi:hypothetical protein